MTHTTRLKSYRIAALCAGATIALSACGGHTTGMQTLPNAQPFAAQMQRAAAKPMHWSVDVGASQKKGALEALDFYAGTMTINVGDSITWHFKASVHTVSFLTARMSPYTAPTTPAGGKTFNGSKFTSSGVLGGGASYTLTFTKAGTWTYNCLLHPPEMVGKIIVNPAGTKYPHPQSWYNGYANADKAADLGAAAQAGMNFPFKRGGTNLTAGISPGGIAGWPPSQATVYSFQDNGNVNDQDATVKVGAVVTWFNESNNEPHTVTFPVAGKPLPKRLLTNPFAPPEGGNTYDGTTVVNSGAFGAGFLGVPTTSFNLRFTKPGTYKYYCLFHYPFGMIGTITVKS